MLHHEPISGPEKRPCLPLFMVSDYVYGHPNGLDRQVGEGATSFGLAPGSSLQNNYMTQAKHSSHLTLWHTRKCDRFKTRWQSYLSAFEAL